VTLDKEMKKLVVRNTNLEHNHPCGESSPDETTRTKRRSSRTKGDVEDADLMDNNMGLYGFVEDITAAESP